MTTSDSEYLRSVALGYRLSQALYVFAELNIADLLVQGPAPLARLAQDTGSDSGALRRLLRVSRAMGLVTESPVGVFCLTERGRLLARDVEGSQWPRVRAVGESWHWGPWGRLLETVTTGKPAFELEYGINCFDFFDRHSGSGDTMMNRVTVEAERRGAVIAGAFDFSAVRGVVDVGGGRGAILGAILSRHPHLRGVLVDLPYALDGSGHLLESLGVDDRCEVVAADFRTDLPQDGDVYVLSAVLHSWSDDDAVRLLRRCLDAGERVVVVDEVLGGADDSLPMLLKDLQLIVFSGGRQRTLDEYRQLADRAGGQIVRLVPVGRDEVLMEVTRRVRWP